jgi:SAM-dependent methyltransferase
VTGVDFREHLFTAPPERRRLLLSVMERLVAKDRAFRILDLGCGTGTQLLDIAASFRFAQCVGIDLSPGNIAQARRMAAGSSDRARVCFEQGDYFTFATDPFDVVIADSVLQNMPVPTAGLAAKIGGDLGPDGLLVASIPYDCLYNRLLWSLRRILRLARGPVLDRVAVTAGRMLHPSWSAESIRERVPYLYLLPTHIDGKDMRDAFRVFGGLAVEQVIPIPHASLAQPKHRLVVFRKQLA